ncbi:retrotransposon protein, putative, ty1-copia subclass [Tanacetum coccineum]
MFFIEQPLPATPVADSNAQMKGYVDHLEHLGYMLPQDLIVGLILNGLTKDFAGFVRNYNIDNMGKMIGELHAKKKSLKAKGKGKANGKGNDKQVYIPKPKNTKPSAKGHPAKDDTCHHCKEVGNGVRAQVEAIRSYDLVLPNGVVICLDNCHYAPSITRGVVSVHYLVENGFVQCFTDFGILVSKNNVHYFNVIHSNGIYEIDMHDLVPNVNSIYNVSTKRPKHNLDSTYLWHYRLADISKKRIEKLKQERLLKSTDDESFDQCVSYFIGQNDRKFVFTIVTNLRETDLLGLLHNDVFKNEVENQLRKTIKALRSDRGGKYISQGCLKDYLKAYGIVQQLTPPYTPQHNDVSERRNRTLLDMVRSGLCSRVCNTNSQYGSNQEGCEALGKRDTPDKLQQRSVKCIFIGYLKETMDVSGRAIDLEEIQDEDTSPSEITSKYIPMEVEVDLPPGCKTVGSKWIFKKKTDMDGIVHTYKARLVAKGYTQLYRVDYEETFSPVADIRAIRILISIVVFYDYEIWQMDVKTAFLNGYLDEDIYMVQPEDFGEATFILGIKIYRDRSKRLIGLGQNAYMDKILKRYKMDNSKRGHIPMQERLDLNKTQGASTPKEVKRVQNVLYALAVRSIMYAKSGSWTSSAVDWKSSKKSTTAMSATKAEYIAASEATMEAVSIRKFISGLGIVPTINKPIRMFCDNSAALHFANEPGVQKGTRHYHRRYHYVHESIALGEIRFLKVHTDDNLANPFMKALSKGNLTQHARSMRLRLASSFM